MHIHKLALFTAALLTASCSSCDEGTEEPSATFAEICPAQLPPQEDCFIPEISQPSGGGLRTVQQFAPICNSPCTKGRTLIVELQKDTKEPINTGNLTKIELLSISTYDKIEFINGFENIKEAAFLIIQSNSVRKIGKIGNITKLSTLEIKNSDTLEEFTEPLPIEDMSEFGKSIYIGGHRKLKNLKMLSNLKRVHQLQISANRGEGVFSTMEGLENLEFVENLTITGNGNLTSLRALKKLKHVPNLLEFENNNNLPTCEIEWFINQLETKPKDTYILNNGPDDVSCPP